MEDRVSKEEMEQAGKIVVSRLDLEGQVAFQVFMRWFEEQLETLHETMRSSNQQRDMAIAGLQQKLRRQELENR